MDARLKNFLDEEDRLRVWPSKRKFKNLALDYLVTKFEFDTIYREKEVNEILTQAHTFSDYALLRRELFNARLLDRTVDSRQYWRCKKEE